MFLDVPGAKVDWVNLEEPNRALNCKAVTRPNHSESLAAAGKGKFTEPRMELVDSGPPIIPALGKRLCNPTLNVVELGGVALDCLVSCDLHRGKAANAAPEWQAGILW
jgi:hypothetical protein